MIRIGIVDDHAIFRSGLRQFLSEQVDFRVAGEAATGREALDLLRQETLDVLLLDLALPDGSGIETLATIKAHAPDLPVLILSAFPEAHYATALLRGGASGYLSKQSDPDEIPRAIRMLGMGRRYVTPAVGELLAAAAAGDTDRAAHEVLSERELQVFLRLAKGESVGHVAQGMSLSVKTVSTYRTRVLRKLHLESNSDLTYYALKNGLIL